MSGPDYTSARFIKNDDGQWRLDRDWTAPATQLEVEALFAHTLKLNRIVGVFVRHFAYGDIATVDGLNDATTAKLRGSYAAAIDVMTPPRVLRAEGVADAGAGQ